MFSLAYLSVCVYCVLQLLFLLLMDNKRRRLRSVKEHYFTVIIIMMIFSFGADMVSSTSQPQGWLFPIAASGNYFEIIINTWMLLVYYYYICERIDHIDLKLKKRVNFLLKALGILCTLVVLSTAITGQIFYYDASRHYFRGPLFWLPMLILYGMMFLIQGVIISQKEKIEVSHYQSLLCFLILPMIGSIFQAFIYGMPFSLMSATLATQVVFTNVQNRSMDTDYLTGAFNRQALDHCLENRINNIKKASAFSALLVDIDSFKEINDTYGHVEGDKALIQSVQLLRTAIGGDAFLARYGGDEFCAVLQMSCPIELENMVDRINHALSDYNQQSQKHYPLSFSLGYGVYDETVHNTPEDFIKWIDAKMYADKKRRKEQI